ncbi:MAG TPA: glycosyltransferase family 4 protein [Propionicimonas sp.]|nr:glycosyltransferase family 4 protein [Propionicimonas sp.]HQA77320.1 glycosyltransferase family 4 protein [Propionicimonas sp.]HQD96632.1 glycosyltransferase family 4 protein [Propionicimonas sp.]
MAELRPLVHAITPGDHFSPLTGSAVPTVVDGLSRAIIDRPARVLVARGTYAERYDSAEAVEYEPAAARRSDRVLDLARSRLGLSRVGTKRQWAAALAGQGGWDPSVIVAHNGPELIPLIDTGRHQAVLYAHNQLLATYGRREAGRCLDPVDAILCVSSYLAEATAERLPKRLCDRLCVVPNGVDANHFAASGRPARGAELRVIFVGRVVPDKGVHVLLEAVRRLGRKDLAVTIVGRPGFAAEAPLSRYEQELRRTARSVPGRVRFASFVERSALPSVLHKADVAVVPSVWPEPFGLTVLEAMAAGAATIASRIGGIPEAGGDAAILIAPGDSAELATALEIFLEDDQKLAVAQAAAVAHAQRCSWTRSAESLSAALAAIEGGGCDERWAVGTA